MRTSIIHRYTRPLTTDVDVDFLIQSGIVHLAMGDGKSNMFFFLLVWCCFKRLFSSFLARLRWICLFVPFSKCTIRGRNEQIIENKFRTSSATLANSHRSLDTFRRSLCTAELEDSPNSRRPFESVEVT